MTERTECKWGRRLAIVLAGFGVAFSQGGAAALSGWEAAIERWDAVVRTHPLDAAARWKLGAAYLGAAEERIDRTERRILLAVAERELDQAVSLAPGDDHAKRLLARTVLLSGNPYKAMRISETLFRKPGPARLEDATQLFTLYAATGMIEHGLRVFGEQLRLEPGWHELRLLTGMLYRKGGNEAEARKQFQQVAGARAAGEPVRRAARAALQGVSP